MSRQVRIDDAIARKIEDAYPDSSLSAGANEALKKAFDGNGDGTGHVIRPAGHDKMWGSKCRHPLDARVGTRCGMCGSRVHLR